VPDRPDLQGDRVVELAAGQRVVVDRAARPGGEVPGELMVGCDAAERVPDMLVDDGSGNAANDRQADSAADLLAGIACSKPCFPLARSLAVPIGFRVD
jgi:hypothetical protein